MTSGAVPGEGTGSGVGFLNHKKCTPSDVQYTLKSDIRDIQCNEIILSLHSIG